MLRLRKANQRARRCLIAGADHAVELIEQADGLVIAAGAGIGSIHHVQCLEPCSGDIWPADTLLPRVDDLACRRLGELPSCRRCGGTARPNILMFCDGGWLAWRTEQQMAACESWLGQLRRPVVIEIGAGTHIPSVRHFGHRVVHAHGGRLVRINPREAEVPSTMDVGIRAGALAGLQAIDERIGP